MSWLITSDQYPDHVLEASEAEVGEDVRELHLLTGKISQSCRPSITAPSITALSVIVRDRETFEPIATHSVMHIPGTGATLEWRNA